MEMTQARILMHLHQYSLNVDAFILHIANVNAEYLLDSLKLADNLTEK
jgi:hypothetical protein